MIGRLAVVGLLVIGIGACSRPGDPLKYTGISAAADLNVTQRTLNPPSEANATAKRELDAGLKTVTFDDGPLAGRSFDIENGKVVGGLNPGETAFLETIGPANDYPTMLVGLNTANSAETYALYSPHGAETRPGTGTASFVGVVVANGYSPTGKGLADGKFSIFANFNFDKVIGTISDLKFRTGGAFPDIHFTADYDAHGPKFYADTMTLGLGTPPVDQFHLEGSTDLNIAGPNLPTGETAGAFSVKAGGTTDPAGAYGLTGVFDSTLDTYTP